MSAERRIFRSTVLQVETTLTVPRVEDRIPIIVRLFKQSRFWFDGPRDYTCDGPPTLVTEKELLAADQGTREYVAEQLLLMGVPQEELAAIIGKLLRYFSLVSIVPDCVPLTLIILDLSVSLLGSAEYHDIIGWVAREPFIYRGHRVREPFRYRGHGVREPFRYRGHGVREPFRYRGQRVRGESLIVEDAAVTESMETYKSNLIPATRSAIEGLKKIKFDSLEDPLIRETPSCVLCLEDFAECVDKLITRLPCKHHSHVDCIVRSLEISHICPLCRYPMPTVEADEPSKP